jgi:hypothetical protein
MTMSVCPYCGGLGRHIWTGIGQCPGMQEDNVCAKEIAQCYQDIRELKALLARAADALETSTKWRADFFIYDELIAELRKAAQ